MSNLQTSGIDNWLSSSLDDIVKQQKIGTRRGRGRGVSGRGGLKGGLSGPPSSGNAGGRTGGKTTPKKVTRELQKPQAAGKKTPSDPAKLPSLEKRLDSALADTEKALKAEAKWKVSRQTNAAAALQTPVQAQRPPRAEGRIVGSIMRTRNKRRATPYVNIAPVTPGAMIPNMPSTALHRQKFARQVVPMTPVQPLYVTQVMPAAFVPSQRNRPAMQTARGGRVLRIPPVIRVPDSTAAVYAKVPPEEASALQPALNTVPQEPGVLPLQKKSIRHPAPSTRTVSIGRIRYPPDEPFHLSAQDLSTMRKLKVVAELDKLPPAPSVVAMGPKPKRCKSGDEYAANRSSNRSSYSEFDRPATIKPNTDAQPGGANFRDAYASGRHKDNSPRADMSLRFGVGTNSFDRYSRRPTNGSYRTTYSRK